MEGVANLRLRLGEPLHHPRLRTTLLPMAVVASTVIVLSAACGFAGRRRTELSFLDPRRPPTANEAVYAAAADLAMQSDERNDVLFFGDSTCSFGIDPIQFEHLTSVRSCNCGTLVWMGPKGFWVILEAYLGHHGKPRAVVLCLSPFAMEISPAVKDPETAQRFISSYAPQSGYAPWQESLTFFIRRGAVNLFASPADPRDYAIDGIDGETYRTFRAKLAQGRGFKALPGMHGLLRDHGVIDGPLILDEWQGGTDRIVRVCEATSVGC